MTWIQRILGQSTPDSTRNTNDPRYWGSVGRVASSGVVVDEDSALSVSAAWAAGAVISSAIAGVPLITYQRRNDGGKDRAYTQHLYTLLHDQPNDAQTAFEWREYLTLCGMFWGNGYSEILPGRTGFVDALDVPFHPSSVVPNIDTRRRRINYYQVTNPDGSQRRIMPDRMFHLRGMSKNGLTGMSVIRYARESLGMALATESFGSRFFSQDATPRGVLTHPGSFEENSSAPARIRQQWEELHSGLSNAHKIAILEEGMKYQQIGMTSEDAQFLQTRQFTVREIARWFSIQPHMIQDLQNATFTNIEAQGQEFVTYTLARWATRWEQSIRMRLILDPNLYAEHLFDALLRGDTQTRYTAYNLAIGKWMSGNEIRSRENLNPSPGLDAIQPEVAVRETITDDTAKPPVPAPKEDAPKSMSDLDILVRSNGHAAYEDE